MSSPQAVLPDNHSRREIRSRPRPACYLCGAQGVLLYDSLEDVLFGSPGTWNFRRCSNSECGLVWLDPMPVEEEIGKAYLTYYTHDDRPCTRSGLIAGFRRFGSALFSLLDPVKRQRKRLALMFLDDLKPGRLLDVGCGNGARLAQFRALGWDVYGQDVDPAATAYAREMFGLDVRLGRLEDTAFEHGFFDCVTLNHVIEHVHDPVGMLRECRGLLKPGGLLVVVTPNANSFASKYFGRFWRGLEPPRHIHLFSPGTLGAVAVKAGFEVRDWSTAAANARSFAQASLLIKHGGRLRRTMLGCLGREIYAIAFLCCSLLQYSKDPCSGEECVVRAGC